MKFSKLTAIITIVILFLIGTSQSFALVSIGTDSVQSVQDRIKNLRKVGKTKCGTIGTMLKSDPAIMQNASFLNRVSLLSGQDVLSMNTNSFNTPSLSPIQDTFSSIESKNSVYLKSAEFLSTPNGNDCMLKVNKKSGKTTYSGVYTIPSLSQINSMESYLQTVKASKNLK